MPGPFDSRAPANDPKIKTSKFSLPRLTKSDFNKRLERELERHVDLIAEGLTKQEKTALQRMKKRIWMVVLNLNPWAHMKEILIHHGTGAAVTAVITEIITIGILPAILTAGGLAGAATFSAASPSLMLTVPAYIAWKNHRMKKKLAEELGFNNLKQLDRLRQQVLGFSTSKRLLSKVYESAEGSVELTIIKRRFSAWRARPAGNIIDLYTLEKIAKGSLNVRILEIIEPLSKEDPAVYTTILIDQIQKHPQASATLSAFIKRNMKSFPFKLSDHQQSMLLLIHEKEQYIFQLKKKARKLKSKVIGLAKNGNIDKQGQKPIGEFVENLIVDLETLNLDIKRFEYSFLSKINLEEEVSEDVINEVTHLLLKRMRDIEEVYKGFRSQANNLSTPLTASVVNMIKRMESLNSKWKPHATAKSNNDNCIGIASKILTQSRIIIQ